MKSSRSPREKSPATTAPESSLAALTTWPPPVSICWTTPSVSRNCLPLSVVIVFLPHKKVRRSEEHTSELQSLMRISYAVFCLKKKKHETTRKHNIQLPHTSTQKHS